MHLLINSCLSYLTPLSPNLKLLQFESPSRIFYPHVINYPNVPLEPEEAAVLNEGLKCFLPSVNHDQILRGDAADLDFSASALMMRSKNSVWISLTT